jgi:hypothetical protein
MDLYASIVAIRRVHTLAIASLEDGDTTRALEHLAWVEAELVVLGEVALEHLGGLRALAEQQHEATLALRDGRINDSLTLIRAAVAELALAEENISRGRNPADNAAILPN